MNDTTDVILSQARNPGAEHEKLVDNILAGLTRRPGVQVTVVPHLYDLSPDGPRDRKSTRLNSSHIPLPRMPSSA